MRFSREFATQREPIDRSLTARATHDVGWVNKSPAKTSLWPCTSAEEAAQLLEKRNERNSEKVQGGSEESSKRDGGARSWSEEGSGAKNPARTETRRSSKLIHEKRSG